MKASNNNFDEWSDMTIVPKKLLQNEDFVSHTQKNPKNIKINPKAKYILMIPSSKWIFQRNSQSVGSNKSVELRPGIIDVLKTIINMEIFQIVIFTQMVKNNVLQSLKYALRDSGISIHNFYIMDRTSTAQESEEEYIIADNYEFVVLQINALRKVEDLDPIDSDNLAVVGIEKNFEANATNFIKIEEDYVAFRFAEYIKDWDKNKEALDIVSQKNMLILLQAVYDQYLESVRLNLKTPKLIHTISESLYWLAKFEY